MTGLTEELFRDDAYASSCDATVIVAADGTVTLDRTVFYPAGGGQPGDNGRLVGACPAVAVIDTRKGEAPGTILHVVEPGAALPPPGTPVTAELDWERRHRLMRMHSALHLLCRAIDAPVTGGQIGVGSGRLDFDIPEPNLDKEAIATRLNGWVADDRPIDARWIDADELDRRPELIRTLSVRPPRGEGRVRLVEIEGVDVQACGGTHVRRTGEIGPLTVLKIEKKGRQNRRVTIALADR